MGKVFVLFVRLGLGSIFLWSSLPKLRQPYDLLSNVYGYELVGPNLGMLTAMALPWLELFLGVCLLGGIFLSGALLTSIALAAVFTFVQASALVRGIDIECGCFMSAGEDIVGPATITRTVLMFFASLAGYMYLLHFRSSPDAQLSPPNSGTQQKNHLATGRVLKDTLMTLMVTRHVSSNRIRQ